MYVYLNHKYKKIKQTGQMEILFKQPLMKQSYGHIIRAVD